MTRGGRDRRDPSEATIPSQTAEALLAARAYVDAFAAPDDTLVAAEQRAQEVSCGCVDPATGALLRTLAALVPARAVVEVGTGAGVSGLWLLHGMPADGVLTSVDSEAEHTRLARESFGAAGVSAPRARLITGRALEVLPRLADGAYDLVLCDADVREVAAYVDEAARLLRPGGLLVVAHALLAGAVADPAQRDGTTVAMRSLVTRLPEDERFTATLVDVGEGLLLGARSR